MIEAFSIQAILFQLFHFWQKIILTSKKFQSLVIILCWL